MTIPIVLGSILAATALVWLAGYSYLRWLFGSSSPKGLPADEAEKVSGALAALERGGDEALRARETIARTLVDMYRRDGYWVTNYQVVFSGDKRYDLETMWWDFKRDPDIRSCILLTALPQLLLRSRYPDVLCQPVGVRFAGSMNSTFFQLLILDRLLLLLSRRCPLGPDVREDLLAVVDASVSDITSLSRTVVQDGPPVWGFADRPDMANPVLDRLMGEWSSNADVDDTAVALSVLGKYGRVARAPAGGNEELHGQRAARANSLLSDARVTQLFRGQLRDYGEHAFPSVRRRFGYIEARGTATYLVDGANDIDPGVNINVLECIATNLMQWGGLDNPDNAVLFREVLTFIRVLAERGILFSPYVQVYYPPVSCYFLWQRFRSSFGGLPGDLRASLDPDGNVQCVDNHSRQFCERLRMDQPRAGLLDRLLMGTLGAESGDGRCSMLRGAAAFFCQPYPVRIAYGSSAHLLALALSFEPGEA